MVASASAWGASQLTINPNQLDLISQDLRQVKDVKRVVDMIGGAGHLIMALRGSDEDLLKATSTTSPPIWVRTRPKSAK